jgi:hypothetical protein
MRLILVGEEGLYVEFLPLAGIERTQAFIEISAQTPKLLDVGEEFSPNLFLVGLRESSDLGDGFFESLDHGQL